MRYMVRSTRAPRAFAGLSVALCALLAAESAQAQQQQAGVTAAVRGQVEIAAAIGAVGRVAKSGEPIYLGNAVKSGPESGLQILLLDQTTFTIGPDSELTIDEFVYDPGKASGKVTATVAKGVFRFVTGQVAKNNPADMLVKMPIGTIGIRGTMAMGSVTPATAGSPAQQEVLLVGPGRDRDSKDRKGALVVSAPNGASVNIDQTGFGSTLGKDGWADAARWTPERLAALQARLTKTSPQGQSSGAGAPGQASKDAGTQPFDTKGTAQLASVIGGALNFGDKLRNDEADSNRRSQLALLMTIPNGPSSYDQLRTVNSGQFYYQGSAALSGGGSYSILADIDFGKRTFGGGNSRVVLDNPGQFSGTVALGTQNYASLSGVAAFQYINTTSVGGLGCQTFSCRTTVNIAPQNLNNTIGATANHAVTVQRADSLGNPTATLGTGSGTAGRVPGQAPQ